MYIIILSQKRICHDCYFDFLTSHKLWGTQKGSHIKWQQFIGTYLNIERIATKPKPTKKCHKIIYKFWKSNDIFLKRKWSNIPFSFLFFTFVKKFMFSKDI
jgi:hypothetical protein